MNTEQQEETSTTPEDDFSDAFHEVVEAASDGQAQEEREGQEAEGQGEQAQGADEQAGNANQQGGEQGEKPANADDDPNSQTWEQRFRTLQGKYNREVVEARRAAKPAESQDTGNADPDGDEELDDIERSMDEDYPTLAKGVEKKAERIARSVLSGLNAELAPIREATRETLRDRHFKAIRDAHADFDDIVKGRDLDSWVDEQPSFVRDQYKSVLERGTANSVVELLSAFKKARGAQQQNTSRRSAANDAMVIHTRSAVAMRDHGGEDKGDFSAGFNS